MHFFHSRFPPVVVTMCMLLLVLVIQPGAVHSLLPAEILKKRRNRADGAPYSLLTKAATRCEVESLAVGTALADNYNSLDENTEWDSRLHSDFLSEYLGFFATITSGIWGSNGKTSELRESMKLQKKGKWMGNKNLTESAYWGLENQWIYMMGDSTMRQLWATLTSPSQGNEFERNSKEWTRENCRRQWPHRAKHPANGNFPEEGWAGKCGNNEVTCDLSGYGPNGLLTFDWKHFPMEDYDEWVFGETGPWGHMKDSEDHTHETLIHDDIADSVLDTMSNRRSLTDEAAFDLMGGAHGMTPLHHHHQHAAHGHGHVDLLDDSPHLHSNLRGGEGLEGEGLVQEVQRRILGDEANKPQKKIDTDTQHYHGNFTAVPKGEGEMRRPDILVLHVGLHTCFHAYDVNQHTVNEEYIVRHEKDLPVLFKAVTEAINRPRADGTPHPGPRTIVIISTAGRIGGEPVLDHCTWRFNRRMAIEAHKFGFAVFEREEVERRLLFKSDAHFPGHFPKYIKPAMHLDAPGPQISTTGLLAMMSCLRKERGDYGSLEPYHRGDPHRRSVPVHSSTDDDEKASKFERE